MANTIADLLIEIEIDFDDSGFERAAQRTEQHLDEVAGSAEQAAADMDRATDRMGADLDGLGSDAERVSGAIDGIGDAVGRVDTEIDGFDDGLDRVSRGSRDTSDAVASLGRAFDAIRGAGLLGVIAAALAALPALAVAAGGALVLGLGGGLAAVGIIAAAQSEEVQAAWMGAIERIKDTVSTIAAPFEPVLIRIAQMVEDTFNRFAPVLEAAFEEMAPAVEEFADQFFTALDELMPVIPELTDAFTKLLGALGPELAGIFDSIADGLIAVTDAVGDNPEAFTNLAIALAEVLEVGLKFVALLIRFPALGAGLVVILGVLAIAFGGPALAIAGVIGIIVALATLVAVKFPAIKDAVVTAFNAVSNTARTVFNWLKDNWPLLAAILTGPIGIAVLLITRNWDSIKNGATAVKDWIVARFNDVVTFIGSLPARIANAASGMWDGITGDFKSAINSIIRLWNGLEFPSFTIGGQDPLGPFGPSLPSVTIGGWDLPNIPLLAHGALLKATPGGVPFVGAERGVDEAVIPLPRGLRSLGQGNAMPPIVINVAGSIRSDRELAGVIRDVLLNGGFRGAF